MYTQMLEFSERVRTLFFMGARTIWTRQNAKHKVTTVVLRMPKDQPYQNGGREWEYIECQDILNDGVLRVATWRNGSLREIKKLATISHYSDLAHEKAMAERKRIEKI